MSPRPIHRRISARVAGVIALLAAALSGGSADASCGHAIQLIPVGAISATLDRPTPDEVPSPTPPCSCQGPHCSLGQGVPVPLLPTAPAKPLPPDAILNLLPPLDAGLESDLVTARHLVPPSRRPADIFHPPRAVR